MITKLNQNQVKRKQSKCKKIKFNVNKNEDCRQKQSKHKQSKCKYNQISKVHINNKENKLCYEINILFIVYFYVVYVCFIVSCLFIYFYYFVYFIHYFCLYCLLFFTV